MLFVLRGEEVEGLKLKVAVMDVTTKSFRQLRVWQLSLDFVDAVYSATEAFPKHQQYSLVQQLQRSAVSVPSNIAEGSSRAGKAEFAQFLYIAKGSLAEVETQLLISYRRKYIEKPVFDDLVTQIITIERMLVKLIKSIKN